MPSRDLVAHHFDSMEQQRDACLLGMWVFLVTEVLLLGGGIAAYWVYRVNHLPAFAAGSRHLDLVLGTLNTFILLISSYTMALGVHAARSGRHRRVTVFLGATVALGLAFMVIKAFEYGHKFEQGFVPGAGFTGEAGAGPGFQLFFSFYFVLTGIHAAHVAVGMLVLVWLAVLAWRGRFSAETCHPVDLGGLYWHFVDVVWIFLYPFLYLVDRTS